MNCMSRFLNLDCESKPYPNRDPEEDLVITCQLLARYVSVQLQLGTLSTYGYF